MSDIRKIIGEEVVRRRAIPFERFMELALYCPNFGYYERTDVSVGREGDFFTSVSVGGLFGELLAWKFAHWLEEVAGPARQIMEAGAHDGRLSADILNWLRNQRPDIFEVTEYWLLEPSANRRKAQERTLREFGGKVRWFDSWEALPVAGVQGVIFSNELLDAMPVRRIGWDASRQNWFEWGVEVGGNDFAWTKMATDGELDMEIASWRLPPELLRVLPDGFTTEVGFAAAKWWRCAVDLLKGGKLLTFDYGLEREEFFKPERKDGTLRAYYRHHLDTDMLRSPGEQDITSQVDFAAVRQAGEAAGLKTLSFVRQAEFLAGIVQAMCGENPACADALAQHSREFQTLTHPEHLGRAFRVLVQSR
jgi:SAM-dependent MidA family methyltransferase